MPISRRKLLTLLAASPLLSHFRGWGQPDTGAIQSKSFFIWLHGVFGITVEKDRTILVSPNLQDDITNKHLYAVGRITRADVKKNPVDISAFEGIKEVKGIKKVNRYVIQGLQPSPAATDIDQRDFAKFSKAELDPSADALFFEVPRPTRILPLRFQETLIAPPAGVTDKLPFSKSEGPVPLLHALQLENFVGSVVSALPAQAAAGTEPLHQTKAGEHHLHIFAEPDPSCHKANCHDGPKALGKLISCYKGIPTFRFEQRTPPPAPLENIVEFADTREQFGFSEWMNQFRYSFQSTVKPTSAAPTTGSMDCPHLLVLGKNISPVLQQTALDKPRS